MNRNLQTSEDYGNRFTIVGNALEQLCDMANRVDARNERLIIENI